VNIAQISSPTRPQRGWKVAIFHCIIRHPHARLAELDLCVRNLPVLSSKALNSSFKSDIILVSVSAKGLHPHFSLAAYEQQRVACCELVFVGKLKETDLLKDANKSEWGCDQQVLIGLGLYRPGTTPSPEVGVSPLGGFS
jgi:hypothetical protein